MTRAYNTATTQQNSGGAVSPFIAGKNKIINGDFGIWQRNTSFTGASGLTSDRWSVAGGESGSVVSRQTFTPGTAPVAGYEGTYFLDFAKNGTTANAMFLEQKMEDVRLFAGQTITISFWMKGSSAFTNEPLFRQNFGSGGSSEVYTTTATNSVTTSWARYSVTVAVPSISGKTIGTSSFLGIWPIRYTGTSNITVSIWGVQVEAGSVATAFQTATGTIQGELAACQRYFQKSYNVNDAPGTDTNNGLLYGAYSAAAVTTGYLNYNLIFPVKMRTTPTITTYDVADASGKVSRVTPTGTDQNGLTPGLAFTSESSVLLQSPSGNSHSGLAFHYTASAEL
jgi:hypothetical protein